MLKNKKILFLLLILLIIIIAFAIGIKIYSENNIEKIEENKEPILTLFKSVSTTTYEITYYDDCAILSSEIGGINGMIPNGKRRVKYNDDINFDKIKEKIDEILSNDVRTNMIIFIDDKEVYVTEEYEVVKELLKIVNVQDITDIGRD